MYTVGINCLYIRAYILKMATFCSLNRLQK